MAFARRKCSGQVDLRQDLAGELEGVVRRRRAVCRFRYLDENPDFTYFTESKERYRIMPVVKATEFQKRVGEFSDIARREPVTVTRHGRPSLVLLSVEDYERLKQLEAHATRVVKVAKLPRATLKAMRTAKLSHLPAD